MEIRSPPWFFADESVHFPGLSTHRTYVPRVVKSYIWAFYKMMKMTTKILNIINKVIPVIMMIT